MKLYSVNDAEVFGNYFREDEHANRHCACDDTHDGIAPHDDGKSADESCTSGVGDGVQGQDRRDRTGEVGLESFEFSAFAWVSVFEILDLGGGCAQNERFHQRAVKRGSNGEGYGSNKG